MVFGRANHWSLAHISNENKPFRWDSGWIYIKDKALPVPHLWQPLARNALAVTPRDEKHIHSPWCKYFIFCSTVALSSALLLCFTVEYSPVKLDWAIFRAIDKQVAGQRLWLEDRECKLGMVAKKWIWKPRRKTLFRRPMFRQEVPFKVFWWIKYKHCQNCQRAKLDRYMTTAACFLQVHFKYQTRL